MCHVFRCDSAPAKEIANNLRDACRRIISEKKKTGNHKNLLKRPSLLPTSESDFSRCKSASYQGWLPIKIKLIFSTNIKSSSFTVKINPIFLLLKIITNLQQSTPRFQRAILRWTTLSIRRNYASQISRLANPVRL